MKFKKIVPVILTVFIFWFFFQFINFKHLISMSVKLSWKSVVSATALYFVSNYFRAERFRLLSGKPASIVQMLRIVFLYGFYNKVLPFRTGEISYAFLMKKSNYSTYTESLSTLLITRIYDVFSAFLLLLIALLFSREVMPLFHPALIASLLLVIVVILYNLPYMFKIIEVIFHRILIPDRFGISSERLQSYSNRIQFLIDWFTKTSNSMVMLKLAVLSFLMWLSLYGTFFILMSQLGFYLPFSGIVIGSVFANFSNLLPVSGVGGFGTMEAGWAVGFTLLGVNRNDAIATGVVINLFIFLCTAGFALIALLVTIYTKKYLHSSDEEEM